MKKNLGKFGNEKTAWILVGIILFVTLIITVNIRTSNLDLLKDKTTGEFIPTALDPFYFTRLAETRLENGPDNFFGVLPDYDLLRGGENFQTSWHKEILGESFIFFYRVANLFGDYSIQNVAVISPVIYFIFSFITFFFLVYLLTKSKIAAVISSLLLSVIPPLLYRSMAGFADHDMPGTWAFLLVLIVFTLSLKFLEGIKKSDNVVLLKSLAFGFLTSLVSSFCVVLWAGIANFIFMIIPFGFFLFWIFKEKSNPSIKKSSLIYYFSWVVSLPIFMVVLFGSKGWEIYPVISKYMLSSQGILVPAILGFVIVDFILSWAREKNYFEELNKKLRIDKYRILYSFGVLLFLGFIFLLFSGRLGSLLSDFMTRIFSPWGEGRVSMTVAENRPPFLEDWINGIGPYLFYLFFGGLILFGIDFTKGIEKKKDRIYFGLFWILMIFGILFSKYSSSSILNGENFISKTVYIGSLALLAFFCIKIYFGEKLKFSSEYIVILSWLLFMLIAARGAVRLFFVIAPFACFMAGFFVYKSIEYARNSKDDALRVILFGVAILGIVLFLMSFNHSYSVISYQAPNTAPSANAQWQETMSWVSENTPEDSLFSHWWDYGYWVQGLGKRATISDGGHFQGDFRNHMFGRYVLTTPNPQTAFSFLKSNNVTHLMIDQTDLGKYGAYSTIGSIGDSGKWDRLGMIPVVPVNPSQTRETEEGLELVYQQITGDGRSMILGGVDDDIYYEVNGRERILSGASYDRLGNAQYKSYVLAITLGISGNDGNSSLRQPEVVFFSGNDQVRLKARYAFVEGELYDFREGVDMAVMVIPRIGSDGRVDPFGAAIYLSNRTFNSLFARLYLMDDPLGEYGTFNLVHEGEEYVISQLRNQGIEIGEFVYYGGFRGPIKIWETEYPVDTQMIEEMAIPLLDSWEWGMLDERF